MAAIAGIRKGYKTDWAGRVLNAMENMRPEFKVPRETGASSSSRSENAEEI